MWSRISSLEMSNPCRPARTAAYIQYLRTCMRVREICPMIITPTSPGPPPGQDRKATCVAAIEAANTTAAAAAAGE